jgi:RNA polymerase sigma factor (sigma-70 family)
MGNPNPPIPEDELEPDSFEALLRLLHPDRERAGEKYEQLRRKLIKFFEWNSCLPPEDLADETFRRLEQKVAKEEIRDVIGFAWGIAKNLRQEARKTGGRTVQIGDVQGGGTPRPDPHQSERAIAEHMQQERRFECLQLCLRRLPESDRRLFLSYHNVKGESLRYRQELANRLGLSLGALRVRVNRLRNQLEESVRQCLAARRSRSRRAT